MKPLRHLLFTPGPLTTSPGVKAAMLRDIGSREPEFIAIVAAIRQQLLALAGVSRQAGFESILMPGSGTGAVEAVLGSMIRPAGELLVVANGAYGERLVQIAERLHIAVHVIRVAETQVPDSSAIDRVLAGSPAISAVAVVHCETTTGLVNPIEKIGQVVRQHGRTYIVDAMSSFGALPIDLAGGPIDALVSSANKCLQGVPGIAFVLARRAALQASEGWARSVSLDLVAQWRGFESSGQFRFTPPTHVVLAFAEALRELEEEGGIEVRRDRYQSNHVALMAGMHSLGFRPVLSPALASPIIASFHTPQDARFNFEQFYTRLAERGLIIYPGKLAKIDSFRIGTIGHLFPADVDDLLKEIASALAAMQVVLLLNR